MKKLLMKQIQMKKIQKYFFNLFFIYIKMTNNYHQKNKEMLQKEARERYQNLSEEEKDKKRQYARE